MTQLFLIFFLITSTLCNSQDNEAIINPCQYYIKLDSSLTDFLIFRVPATFKIEKKSNLFAHIYLETCDGKLVLEERDSSGFLLMKGEYMSCNDLIEEEYIYFDIDTFKDKVGVKKMCLPKKNGEWKYWTITGELYKVEKYSEGVLIYGEGIYEED